MKTTITTFLSFNNGLLREDVYRIGTGMCERCRLVTAKKGRDGAGPVMPSETETVCFDLYSMR